MAVRFASGKESWYVCDRCGQRYRYPDRKLEWTGALTGHDCWEPKHEQLTPPKNVHDAIGLRQARPERIEPLYGGGLASGALDPTGTLQPIPPRFQFLYPEREHAGIREVYTTLPTPRVIASGMDAVLQ